MLHIWPQQPRPAGASWRKGNTLASGCFWPVERRFKGWRRSGTSRHQGIFFLRSKLVPSLPAQLPPDVSLCIFSVPACYLRGPARSIPPPSALCTARGERRNVFIFTCSCVANLPIIMRCFPMVCCSLFAVAFAHAGRFRRRPAVPWLSPEELTEALGSTRSTKFSAGD